MKEYKIEKGQIVLDIIPFEKGQKYEVIERLDERIWNKKECVYQIQVDKFLESGKMKFKNLTVWFYDELSHVPSKKEITYRLIEG